MVKEHEIVLSGSPFTQATNNVNLNRALFAAGQTADISGFANRGNLNNAIMDGGTATNGWTITATRVINGVTTPVTMHANASMPSDEAKESHPNTLQLLNADFVAGDYTEDGNTKITLSITMTPRDSGDRDAEGDGKGRDLTGSAKTFTLVMTKP